MPSNQLQKITSSDFVHTFHGIWKSVNRRFCFILGAGASKSSGIKTGGELAKEWLDEIKSRLNDRNGAFDKFIQEKGIDVNNPGTHYSTIYEECFSIDPSSGFEYINREMENARPGYGYSVLAQILASKHHNVVITTNFDSLTEEALYTYTSKRPLICGHESLAVFAKPSIDRPLIVKIHRDRFLDPQSRSEEVNAVNEVWAEALYPILRNCIPVFIGYGGNDGSLMGYLDKILKYENIFWCERTGVHISEKVKEFLDKHNGKLVEIEGFDELMFLLQAKLDLEKLDNKITLIANERAEEYRSTFEKILKRQAQSSNITIQEAAERIANKAGDDWIFWMIKATSAKDNDEKEKIFLEGIESLPNCAELHGEYALFLEEVRKNYDEAEEHYKLGIRLSPQDSDIAVNFATFLNNVRGRHHAADVYYQKALEISPDDAVVNGNYAGFLLSGGDKNNYKLYLQKALETANRDDLKVELQFYLYAHIPIERENAFFELKRMLCKGVRSKFFYLQLNVDRAIQDGHPDPVMLQRLADIITKDAPLGDLCDGVKKE